MQPSTMERISSGSERSDSAVNPDRSANRTVTQRRSPSMRSVASGGEEPPASHAAPHAPQKRKPGGLSSPHAAHDWARAAPQWPQKRCAASPNSPQPGQTLVPAKAQSPYAYKSAEMW